jgi:hypothetical protein
MSLKYFPVLLLFMICLCPGDLAAADVNQPVRLSVFNFGTTNLEASGYGTTVTNMLAASLATEPSLSLLDRRDLEAFLSLNDLQQNDILDNVIGIGSRLNLDMVVAGTVEKKGGVIYINAKIVHIPQKKIVFSTQARAFGDAGLQGEIRTLRAAVIKTVAAQAGRQSADSAAPVKGPLNIKKRTGSQKIQLTWEDPPGNDAAGYEVFRGPSDQGPFIRIANTTRPEYLDQNVKNASTYVYKIRSITGKGIRSDFSDPVTAEIAPAPNPPVILKAEGRIKSIQLTWSPSPIAAADPLPMKGYKVYRAKTEEGPYREAYDVTGKDIGLGAGATATTDKLIHVTIQDSGLEDGQDYYYQVTAYNEKHLESEFSVSIKGATTPAVTGLTAQGDMIREIRLSWNAIPSPLVKGYHVYRSVMEKDLFTKIRRIDSQSAGKIQWVDKDGLADNQTYYYRVTGFESADTETSPTLTVQAATKGKPPVPTGLKAVSGLVKRIDLSWIASPAADVEGYNLYRSQEKYGTYTLLKRIEGRNNNTYTDGAGLLGGFFERLEDNRLYYYAVKSFNKVNVESDLSDIIGATTKARPARPSSLKGETLKVKSAPLFWSANPEKDIVAYRVYRSLDPAGAENFSMIVTVNKTDYTDSNLKDGQTCRYRIQAEDKDGLLSDFSDAVLLQTKPKPRAPEGLISEIKAGKMELRWSPGQEKDIVQYVVYEKKFFGIGTEKIAAVQKPMFIDISPPKGKTKTYVVTAVDQDGLESDVSREFPVTGP